jgi:hypothetical protein
MAHIDYPQVIKEDLQQLEKLEKRHRYSHLFHRMKMLRLLKSAQCSNLGEAAKALGYSWRQCQRWFQEFRRALSNMSFKTVELLQEGLTRTFWSSTERSPLAYSDSLVSLGGWKLSRRYDTSDLDRY